MTLLKVLAIVGVMFAAATLIGRMSDTPWDVRDALSTEQVR